MFIYENISLITSQVVEQILQKWRRFAFLVKIVAQSGSQHVSKDETFPVCVTLLCWETS